MSEFKGTKSQWKIEGVDKTFVYALNEKGTNAFSLNINNDGRTELVEQQANALLISKAPEILAMLEELKGIFDKYSVDFESEFFKYKKPLEQLIKEAKEL